MSAFDLILRGGSIVTDDAVRLADLGVKDGLITALEPDLAGAAREEIDARGRHIFPGIIDSHVHFNEPGRAHWEGFATGTSALAAGGGTLCFDMPLNSHPPTLDGESFDRKRAAAEAAAVTDFALWGGLTPLNLDHMPELAARGVIGFKAFMSASGIEEFPCADAATLRTGMKQAAALGLLVAVHAESDALTRELATTRIAQGRISARDYLESRPVAAELEAIQLALDLAGETGCRLHVVHVSSGEGVALITATRRRGVDATCETCPHYLTLTEEDVLRLGARAKCAPPLRPASVQAELWAGVARGEVDTIGSDHSPAPADLKVGTDFFKLWGGIAGVQHTLPLLLTEAPRRGVALPAVARLLAANVAGRFRLPAAKGALRIGAEADVALVDLAAEFEVREAELLDRHRFSPYVGCRLRGRVMRTLLRGRTVFLDGKIVSQPAGRLVKPAPSS